MNWDEASTVPNDYSRENVYEDESGTYTANRLVFLEGNPDTKKIEIRQGTRIICDGALAAWWDCEEEDVKEAIVEELIIPDSVTQIGANAFSGCSSLQSIVVSEGNTIYDSRNNCNAIIETESNILVAGCSQTVIPDSVTQIGKEAFCRCSSLQSIVIPDSVTRIEGRAFYHCSSLQSIVIPKGTKEKFQKLLPGDQHLLKEE